MYTILGLISVCITIYCLVKLCIESRCRHIWKVVDVENIIVTFRNQSTGPQTIKYMVCQNCGAIVMLNLTTGESKTLCFGGALYKENNLK